LFLDNRLEGQVDKFVPGAFEDEGRGVCEGSEKVE
jgi:hypothetical protein